MGDERTTANRDAKGRLGPGNNLRREGMRVRARNVSIRLRKEMVRRFENEVIDDTTGEKFGRERAMLKHYFVMMSIMADVNEAAKDRLKAAEQLANRLDGKPVEEVELSANVESGSPLERTLEGMTADQLLEVVRAARGK